MTGWRVLSGLVTAVGAGALTLLYLFVDMFSVNWVAIAAGFCWGASLILLADALAERITPRRPTWRILSALGAAVGAGCLTLLYLGDVYQLGVTPEWWKAMLVGGAWGGTLTLLGDGIRERIMRRRGRSRAESPKGR